MTVVIIDTWAYWELAQGGARAAEVAAKISAAGHRVTVREVIAETFNFLVGRTGRRSLARDWLEAVRASDHHILEPGFETLCAFIEGQPPDTGLSWTDHAVAWAADQHETVQIATADRAFRRLGLDPLFAPSD